MKGYLIEIRPHSSPDAVIASGSLMKCANEDRRHEMSERLMGKAAQKKMSYGPCFAIEYEGDWSEPTKPSFKEIARYDLT